MKKRVFILLIIGFILLSLNLSLVSAIELKLEKRITVDRSNFDKNFGLREAFVEFDDNIIYLSYIVFNPLSSGSAVYAQKFDNNLEELTKSIRLTDDFLSKRRPKINLNPANDEIVIAWQEGTEKQKIKAASFDKNFENKKELKLNFPTPYRQGEHSFDISNRGAYSLAWTDFLSEKTPNNDVKMLISDKDAQPIVEDNINIAIGSEKQSQPDTAFLTNSNLIIVYSIVNSPVSYGNDIRAATYSIDEGFLSDEIIVTNTFENQFKPVVTRLDDETSFIVWEDYDNGNSDLIGAKLSFEGEVSEFVTIASKTIPEKDPVMALNDEYLVIVWSEETNIKKTLIKAQLLDHSLNKIGDVVVIDDKETYKINPTIDYYDDQFVISYSIDSSKQDIVLALLKLVDVEEEMFKPTDELTDIEEEKPVVEESPMVIERKRPCVITSFKEAIVKLFVLGLFF